MFRLLLCSFLLLSLARAGADEYDTLRAKWKDTIVGAGYDTQDADVASKLTSIANAANSNWTSMDKSPTRTFLWSDLASTSISSHLTSTYSRLRAMALAYATPGCSLQGNATLLADTLSGLDWMHANRYNATKAIYDNWWDFEIGSPLQLVDMAVLLYDQLSPTQMSNFMGAVEKFTPSATTQAPGGTTGTFTGANRMWKIRVVAVRGCVVKDATKLVAARDAFSNLFVYVTSGDGFYTDGSYIQHTIHPYTAGYGASLLSNIAPVMNWLSGSTWAVTDPLQSNLYRWVFDSVEPIIYRGAALDFVRGREAGRSGASPQATGDSMMDSVMQIAQFAPGSDGTRMKSLVKEWALSNTARDFVTSRPLTTMMTAKQLMADTNVVRRGELTAHYTFAEMDRVMHLGGGYGFGLSMCSTRIANFESINGENLRGWFTGDGMTILYNADLTQYADNYWATIDQYRVPGVTADVTHNKLPPVSASIGPRAQGQSTLSPHAWVGGATLGKFGAAGMQFKGVSVTLTGLKSWFMFDDEIVCLGAGITSTDSRPIETTVENRKLNTGGSNAFTVNGTAKSSALGWTETMTGVNWASLGGTVTGSDIGYYFPTSPTIKGLREAHTGAISDIDDGASTTPITRNYLRLTFEHGSNPSNASYQYVLLPGRNATRTGHYAAAPQVTVLANNTNVQAAAETTLGITAANFWTDTTQSIGGITSNKKASVLVRNDGGFIDVSVSDPTQLNTGSITLQIALDGGTLVSADFGVTVTQSTPTIAMSVNVSGAQGKTFKARFYTGTPQIVSLTPMADSYVYDATASADSNFGTATSMTVKKSATGFNRESFLRFNVPATNGIFLGGTLKLMCLSVSTPGVHGVAKVDDTSWIESGAGSITWNNKPAANATVLGTWTPAALAVSTANVTSVVPASGLLSLKVYGTTQTADGFVTYGTRENSTVANRPVLSLAYGHTPPDVSITSPADGDFINHAGPVTITASAQATDGAVTSVAFYDGNTLLGTSTPPTYSFTPTLGGGAHDLKAIATDANGLTRTSLIRRVDVAYPPVANASSVNTPQATSVDVDLLPLITDADTSTPGLKLQLGTAANGTVTMLADGHTARFTPTAGYSGAASFGYTVTDTSRDDRTLINYAFQNSDVTDSSGQGRDGALNVQGTGAADFVTDSPLASYTKSLAFTENSTAGAARLDRSFDTTELDLKNDDWTIAGWFKRATATNIDVIAHLGTSAGFGSSSLVLAYYGTNSTLTLTNYNSANVQDINITKGSVTTGTWHHFAIIRSGTTVSLYVDGTLVGSDTAFSLDFTNTAPVKFGGGNVTTVLDRWLNGSLADLAIFKGALTGTEITKLSTSPVQWFGGQTATASVNVTVLTPVENWRQTQFGTTSNTGLFADTADKDNDGLSNLLEYACATNPNSNNPSPHSATRNGTVIDFLYTKNKSATDVSYTVEWSDTLSALSWSTSGVSAPAILSDNGTTQQIKVTVPAGTGVAKRFVHLKVTRP